MLTPLQTATLVTAIAATLMAIAAWVMYRYIPAAEQEDTPMEITPIPAPVRTGPGRHRLENATTPFRLASFGKDPHADHLHVTVGDQMIAVPAERAADFVP